MFHSMFMSKPAASVAPAFEPELDLCDLYEEELFEPEFPNGEFPVPGVNYFPHNWSAVESSLDSMKEWADSLSSPALHVANCYGG